MITVKFLKKVSGSFNGVGSPTTHFAKDEIAELPKEHETTKIFLENGFAEVHNEKPQPISKQAYGKK